MTTHNQETALIHSIQKQAEDEAQRILESAHRVVEERKKSTDDQIERLQRDNKEKENQQLKAVAEQGQQKIASLERKQMLEIKDKAVTYVVGQVKEKFKKLAAQPEFRDTMIEWTVEAALGLGEKDPVLKLTESCKAFADDSFCKEAAERYKEWTGSDIQFTLSSDMIQKGFGIVLEAKNGRTAYNNLLENRIYRHKDAIEAIVLKDIFNE